MVSRTAIRPRRTHIERKPFNLLRDASVNARYSRHYTITREELDWIVERPTSASA